MNNEPSDTFTIVHPDRSGGLGAALRRLACIDPRLPADLAGLLDELASARRGGRGTSRGRYGFCVQGEAHAP